MITLFSIPKPFTGHTGIIQRNALRSWRVLSDTEIILFGNEEGVAEAATQFECRHVPDVTVSEYGTPYLDEVFKKAQEMASGKYLCYVNSDIILYDEIAKAINSVPFKEFLMTGQRWDIEVTAPVYANYASFLLYVARHHSVQDFPGMDYFVFPKGMITEMPAFIVGRRGWDNWLVYHIRSRGIAVIDATDTIHAVHQNHDYTHIKKNEGERWENCPESEYNLNLVKNQITHLWELGDATHYISDGIVLPKMSPRRLSQGLILVAPKQVHEVMDPFYRAGHLLKYGMFKVLK
jgi:hypothetical protein